MRSKLFLFFAVVFLLSMPAPNLHANILNGDFSSGLDGWMHTGDTTATSGAATLGDDGFTYSNLYQGVALIPGTYSLDFDFENSLSSFLPSGDEFAFPDTFFATLYFADDLFTFSPESGAPEISLFSMDSSGSSLNSGTIGPSALGGDWSHFSMTFDLSYAYAIPTFELFDLNYINGDSTASIDNVAIVPAAVPEPGTLVSMAFGLIGLAVAGRRKLLR